MSYQDGISAIMLEMPPRVPRTEYSANHHWELINRVLGTSITPATTHEERLAAGARFMKAWNYDFLFSVLTHYPVFNGKHTRMGHASYATGGTDFSSEKSELYDDFEEALKFDPWELFGSRDHQTLVQEYNDHFHDLQMRYTDTVNMTGIYVTGISGLIEIFGWDMLLTCAGMDYKGFGAIMERYADWIAQYFNALAESESPVVMVHDDIVWTSGPFINPDWYRTYLFPAYKRLFKPLIESGKRILYTSDGTYTEFIADIAACGVNGFVLEPTTDLQYVAEHFGKTHVIVGNADTRILLSGTRDDIYREVKRCMDIGKRCPGYFMAVGNHIPPNTPIESCLWYNEIYEKLSRR